MVNVYFKYQISNSILKFNNIKNKNMIFLEHYIKIIEKHIFLLKDILD